MLIKKTALACVVKCITSHIVSESQAKLHIAHKAINHKSTISHIINCASKH